MSARTVPQARFCREESFSCRVPDLEEVWGALADNPALADVAALAKGLDYSGHAPPRSTTYSERRFSGGRPGFVRFGRGLELHELPKLYWMNLDASVVSSARSGTKVATPQVLLNYARVSRVPWRLKALIDKQGHQVTSRFIPVRTTRTAYSIET